MKTFDEAHESAAPTGAAASSGGATAGTTSLKTRGEGEPEHVCEEGQLAELPLQADGRGRRRKRVRGDVEAHVWWPPVVYFLVFGAWGALDPYLPLYFRTAGFTDTEAGVFTSINRVMGFVAGPGWGALADRTHRHQQVLMVGLAFSTSVAMCMLWAQGPIAMAFTVTAYAALRSAVVPIIDAAVLSMQDDSTEYGKSRLWGAIGFGVSSLLAGVASNHSNRGLEWAFFIFAALSALLSVLLFSVRLTFARMPAGRKMVEGLRQIFTHRDMCVFFCVVTLSGVGAGVIDTFLYIRLSELPGGSSTVMGASRLITCVSEIPFFRFAGAMIRRLGVVGVVGMAQLAYVVRFVWYACLTRAEAVLPIEVLHGLTFASMWASSCSYAHDVAPTGMEATIQAFVDGAHWGLGSGLGASLGGIMYQSLHARSTFLISAGIAGLSLSLSVVWGSMKRRPHATPHPSSPALIPPSPSTTPPPLP